jgi:hypothetical protein
LVFSYSPLRGGKANERKYLDRSPGCCLSLSAKQSAAQLTRDREAAARDRARAKRAIGQAGKSFSRGLGTVARGGQAAGRYFFQTLRPKPAAADKPATASAETPLARWLVYLGIDAAGLSRRLGLHHNAVGLAAVRGSRSCRWLREAELLLSVPARVLVSIPPDDPRTAPYRTTALVASAEWRLRNQAG